MTNQTKGAEKPMTDAAEVQDRADRAASALALLFARRPELRGIHAPADLAEDALRWCA
ncbi:hypothetical protein [Nocardioides mangrovicus]|uniref:hypothetical protein n=1 Tax=Nocardioides mangrovicus TaxID=2478913 RepID=UPI0013142342|nr:hypothetical protein [Nocardioides mangrovicus]